MLILLLCFYMLVAHWLACIWYSIGRSDSENYLTYSWLWKLGNVTQVSSLLYYKSEVVNSRPAGRMRPTRGPRTPGTRTLTSGPMEPLNDYFLAREPK
jgi:hypothetical protein